MVMKIPSLFTEAFAEEQLRLDTVPHLMVVARAGTGKTTTIVEGLHVLRGRKPAITPSDEQQAVWDSIKLSSGAASVAFMAFGKDVAYTLEKRVPTGIRTSTLNRSGYGVLIREYGELAVDSDAAMYHIADILGVTLEVLRKEKKWLAQAVSELVGLCKVNMTGFKDYDGSELTWEQSIESLARHYGVDLHFNETEVYRLVPQVLERMRKPFKMADGTKLIDFNDQVWLPVVNKIHMEKFDVLFGDEVQDWNRAQQAYAMLRGHRLILVGDPKQSIFGFNGADGQSMKTLHGLLSKTSRGVEELKLTLNRRSAQAIIRRARKYVYDIRALPDAPEGIDRELPMDDYRFHVKPGDFVIARVNSVLVRECLKFLRQGIAADIMGKNIGNMFVNFVRKLSKDNDKQPIPKLLTAIEGWRAKTLAGAKFQNERNTINDKATTIRHFAELPSMHNAGDVIDKITSIYSDNFNGKHIIKFATIHKIKGMEAYRVFILRGPWEPRTDKMQAHELEQEENLKYVAITRPKFELVFVHEGN